MSKIDFGKKVLENVKRETIKILMVSSMKKSFPICEHNFFIVCNVKYLEIYFGTILYLRMLTDLVPKVPTNYVCENCDYTTCRKSQYERHLLTSKHINTYKILTQPFQKFQAVSDTHACECGKNFKHRQSLYNHKKNCKPNPTKDVALLTNLVYDVLKSNQELQTQMIELCKNGLNSNNVITNNSNNKTFNLSVFLNEQCKDAMNMKDFVDSIQLQYSDLENVGRLGFVNGISDIIIKNLKALDIHRRPVHCADLKREIMYVKENNEWNKEAEDNNKIRRAIKCIAQKNSKNLVLFKQKYPDCLQGDSKSSDRYNKLMVEAFGGGKTDDATNEDKIIRRISKEVTIDKSAN
jgi:hypothetical protein